MVILEVALAWVGLSVPCALVVGAALRQASDQCWPASAPVRDGDAWTNYRPLAPVA